MRTTLTIDSQILAEFKRRAAEKHRTLSGLIEEALREHLSRGRDQAATKPLDFPIVGGGGVAPDVDLTSNAALSDYVDRADGAYERFTPPAGDVAGGSAGGANETAPAAETRSTARKRPR